jgi:RNA polymerase sigma factor (sigma-70 family)
VQRMARQLEWRPATNLTAGRIARRGGGANRPKETAMTGAQHAEAIPTVFVVDDDAATRRALAWMLESAGRRVEAFASAADFLGAYRSDRAGCLLLDMRMPGMNGLDLQDELIARAITLPVIMLSGYGEVAIAVEVLQRGALDFIEKPVDEQRLQRRIDDAFALDAERRRQAAVRRTCSTRLERLTPREREVMDLVVAGKANKVVAYELGISQKTVESHRARVMSKLEVQSLADLVRLEWLALQGEPTRA